MTNEQLAQLRDPEHRQAEWWREGLGCMRCDQDWFVCACEQSDSYRTRHYTGPDWHASDDACFRDWRPVLLAAGWAVYDGALDCYALDEDGCIQAPPRPTTYRAAILAAVAWLAEHKPELLREAIARMEGGK